MDKDEWMLLENILSCVGTYRYMSPEVYGYPPRGPRQKPTAQIDVYSAGLVLWEIVERRLVHSEFGPKSFDHVTFFYDFWNGLYELEQVQCNAETLKNLIARCAKALPDQRPTLKECY
ncbi:unnamed protein product, partial [Mesorhabditis belari]|uniref:Protein kinase domain-containing protein n=1 Tax=Mesorhabditis belari TaxID=2138241 RepID=A0AAF3FMH6_9BILA